MDGWAGVILRIDLSSRKVSRQPLPQALAKNYIGGRGFAAKILYDELKPGIDALGPENKLVLAVGPLSGTPLGFGRITYAAKSPQSGLYNEGNSGGFLSPELRFAGYDMVIIEGISNSPVYLTIDDEKVDIKKADHLWGKPTSKTYEDIVKDFGDRNVQVASIGPAAENLVNPSIIVTNLHRTGGRSVATVMGSKRLKAIAVRGSGGVQLAKPRKFLEALKEIREDLNLEKSIDHFTKHWGLYGSQIVVSFVNEMGGLGTFNCQETEFKAIDRINEIAFKKYVTKPKACFCCPFPSCSHWTVVKHGPYAGTALEGVQAGATIAFGSMLGVNYFPAIVKAQALCNDLGLDLFVGIILAWAFECYEKGIISKRETDGLDLTWGNHEVIMELLRKIAYREGFGNLLADGVKKASKKIAKGSERFALHIKGMEWDVIEPRAFYTFALALAVNDVGADHTRIYPPYPPTPTAVPPEIIHELNFDLRKASMRLSPEEKGPLVKWLYDSRAVLDSLEFCIFASRGRLLADFRPLAKALSSATGIHYDMRELLRVGERICNVERAFNVREGLTRKDDTLPERFLREPAGGGSAGSIPPLEPMLDDYYRVRGWNMDTGIPTEEKLEKLDLKNVASELKNLGKLP